MSCVQIFSAHIDDAVLSLGGSILDWRSQGIEVHVYNVFSKSNWIHPESGVPETDCVETVTAIRKEEELEVANILGFQTHFWDFLDAPLRDGFSKEQEREMELQISGKIKECLNKKDLFFFPIGIIHEDHKTLGNICKPLIDEDLMAFFYEDLPYYGWGRSDYKKDYLSFKEKYTPVVRKINFDEKAALIQKYESQIIQSFLNSMRAYAYHMNEDQYYERYWKR